MGCICTCALCTYTLHIPFPCLLNALEDCIEIWCVARDPFGESYTSHMWGQGRRHGFFSGVSNRRQGGQPTPKYSKNRKKHRILATSFSNLGGRPARFSKVRGSGPPPDPPVGDAPVWGLSARAHPFHTMVPSRSLVHRRSRRPTGIL